MGASRRFPPVYQGSDSRVASASWSPCFPPFAALGHRPDPSRGRPLVRKALNENPRGPAGRARRRSAIVFAVLLFTTVLKKEAAAAGDRSGRRRHDRRRGDRPATPIPPPRLRRPRPGAAATDPGPPPPPPPSPHAPGDRPPRQRRRPASDQGPAQGRAGRLRQGQGDRPARHRPEGGSPTSRSRSYTEALKSRDDVEVFVVKSKDIADYARITSGVAVNRTPALVVIRPAQADDGVPDRDRLLRLPRSASVQQALEDALYDGPTSPPTRRATAPCAATLSGMSGEAFEHYLGDDSRRGDPPARLRAPGAPAAPPAAT